MLIFSHDNCLRVNLREVVKSIYFANFIYTCIALNSLLLMLDEPALQAKYEGGPYQKSTITFMLNIISVLFIVEALIKIIVMGLYSAIDKKTYLQDGWNILDFVIVCFSVLTVILE